MKFDEGDEVKALVTDEASRIFEGETYVVEFAYDDEPSLPEPLYSLHHRSGNSGMEAFESQLERTRTRAEMDARKLPTALDLIKALGPNSWRDCQLEVHETDIGGETDAIELYGRTAEGLTFGARMVVSDIWHTDF